MRRYNEDHHLAKSLVTVMGTLLSVLSTAGYAEEAHPGTHREVQGVVIEKGGSLSVQTPDGSTYQLNPNRSRCHGHEPPKVRDEVTVVFDENNLVSEIHPKGTQGIPTFPMSAGACPMGWRHFGPRRC